MKRLSIVMMAFFFAILFFSGNAFSAEMPATRFIPGSYVQYQRHVMTAEELQTVKKGGRSVSIHLPFSGFAGAKICHFRCSGF